MVGKLIEWAVNNRFVVFLLAVGLAVVGTYAFLHINVEAYPDPAPAIVEIATQYPGASAEEVERQVTALRQLASVLGATFLIEEHDDVVAAVTRVARERGSTYIMVGESKPPRTPWARLREPLPQRLMRATPAGVDVRIVAHRGAKKEEGEK